MPVIRGWTVRAHPLLLDQLEKLVRKKPEDWQQSANAKLLAALFTLIFDRIPQDPASNPYVQGRTLRASRRHWFRAKFSGGRFRLVFRYSTEARVIISAWVNDENTLRTYGSKTDAYAVFKGMLDNDNPPDDWAALLKATSGEATEKRFDKAHLKADRNKN